MTRCGACNLNRGVGPAHEWSLHVRIGDRYVTSVSDLIATVLGPDQVSEAETALDPMKNSVHTRFIPGGDQQFVFRMTRRPENAQFWDRLNASRANWNVEYCYCSVFQECWRVPGVWAEPVSVKECPRDEAREFTP
jgi:hypothetical protein